MASQGGQRREGTVAVSGRSAAASGNGRVANRNPDQIVADIERTRQNLARTIDSLADRVSPSSNIRRVKEQAAEQLSRPEIQLAIVAAALAATGLAIYRIWGRRRG
ncbi:MAG TPA: DUF3618 domain-containing protein [Streptosporangiaceae bacterium]